MAKKNSLGKFLKTTKQIKAEAMDSAINLGVGGAGFLTSRGLGNVVRKQILKDPKDVEKAKKMVKFINPAKGIIGAGLNILSANKYVQNFGAGMFYESLGATIDENVKADTLKKVYLDPNTLSGIKEEKEKLGEITDDEYWRELARRASEEIEASAKPSSTVSGVQDENGLKENFDLTKVN